MKSVASGGLREMILLISSKDIQRDLFMTMAPDINKVIDLNQLPAGADSRADVLFAGMEALLQVNATQHRNLFCALNTIAAVSVESASMTNVMDAIKACPELQKRYRNDLKHQFGGKNKSANIAAYVAICAHDHSEGSQEAIEVWKMMVARATDVAKGTRCTLMIEHSKNSLSEREQGILRFQKKLEERINLTYQQADYVALVMPNSSTGGITRYYVRTSPIDGDVMQRKKGEHAFAPGERQDAEGFEIRHFYTLDRLDISEPPAGDGRWIAALFAQEVLGVRIVKKARRYYENCLPAFRTREGSQRQLRMPSWCRFSERACVSKLKFSVCERDDRVYALTKDNQQEYLPCEFSGDFEHDIYDQIAMQLQQDKFPPELWQIEMVEIMLRLCPYKYDDNGKCMGKTNEPVTIRFTVKNTHFSIAGVNKHKADSHLMKDIKAVQESFGLTGEVRDVMLLNHRRTGSDERR